MNPYIRFKQDKKLHRQAITAEEISKAFDHPLFENLSLQIEAGERVAIIGTNGIGKTTLLRCLLGDIAVDSGKVKLAEQALGRLLRTGSP